jgi:hypothetical protein
MIAGQALRIKFIGRVILSNVVNINNIAPEVRSNIDVIINTKKGILILSIRVYFL